MLWICCWHTCTHRLRHTHTHTHSHTNKNTHTHTESFCLHTEQDPKNLCIWYTLVLTLVALSKKLKHRSGCPTMYIKDWLRKKSHTALPTSTVSLIGVACVLVKGLCSWDTASSSNSLSTATGVVGVLLLSPCSAAAFGTEPLALLEEAREFGALPPHPTGGSVAEESFAGALGSVKTFMPFMAAISRRSCAPKRFAFCIKRTCLRFSSDIPQTLQCPRHIRKECPGHRLEDTAVQYMQQTMQSQSMSSFFKTARIARRVVCTSRRCLRRTSTVKAWGEAFMERRRTFGGIPSEGQGKHPS